MTFGGTGCGQVCHKLAPSSAAFVLQEPVGLEWSRRKSDADGVGQRHRVLMQFGDQLGDFVSVLSNTDAGRSQAMAPYIKRIGSRWFVLPNPIYGSWEPALFNNEWRTPRDQHRQQKIDTLRID